MLSFRFTRSATALPPSARPLAPSSRGGFALAFASLLLLCGGALAQTKPGIVLNQTRPFAVFPSGGALGGGAPAGSSMAVNSSGNLIASTTYGGQIVLFNGATGASTVLGSYNNPGPVAVDAADNLYIADVYDTTIVKVPYVNGAYAAVASAGSSTPVCTGSDTAECTLPVTTGGIYGYASMAFDPSGNLFFSSTNGGTYANALFECNAACLKSTKGTSTLLFQEPVSSSAQLYIGGIAADIYGDLFFTDSATNQTDSTSSGSNLKELLAATGGTGFNPTPRLIYNLAIAKPGAYDNQLDGVAVDAAGNVYFATEFDGIFAFPSVKGVVATTSMYTVSTQGAKLLTSDGKGTFYTAAYSNTLNGDAATAVSIATVLLPSVGLGSSSTASNVSTFFNNTTGCSPTPSATYAAVSNEFTAATTGTCSSANITGASIFATTVTFTPTAAGTRSATLTATGSDKSTGSINVTGVGLGTPAPTPTFSPAGGTYTTIQSVTISDSTPRAVIYYTTDGSTPTTGSAVYSNQLQVAATETIKAIAVVAGNANSAVASATYTINLPPAATPTFLPAAGTYTAVQNVQLADTTPGAAIYYTVDGTTPTTSSALYSGAISVGVNETIKAFATATGYNPSAVASAAYIINLPTATPVFAPAGGTFNAVQTVTLTDSTPGAVIYYTTDGTTPTTKSTVFTTGIPVNVTTTIQAVALAPNYTLSAVAPSTYTIALPTFSLAVNPNPLVMSYGGQGLANVTIGALNTFTGPVTFACPGLPAGLTCVFTPATVTPAGTYTVTSVLAVNSTPASSSVRLPNSLPGAFSGTTFALALCLFGWRRRRGIRLALVLCLGLLGATVISGCGSSNSTSHAATTSTLTVTATSGTLVKTANLTVTLQ